MCLMLLNYHYLMNIIIFYDLFLSIILCCIFVELFLIYALWQLIASATFRFLVGLLDGLFFVITELHSIIVFIFVHDKVATK